MPEIVESLGYKPRISIIVPVYNPPELLLREMIQSVLDQVYPYWELCLADDASPQPHVKAILEEYAAQDERIKVKFREQNGHISAASNSALELATGEFISLLDHDDLLTPDALYEVVLLLNQHPEADMIYSDEDKMNELGQRQDPFFKPDWCPDSFLSRMYVCHLGTYRRSIINEIGGFRLGYEGSQDYDLVLRFTEKTNKIFHIPKVLYHWRIHSASAASGDHAKPYAYDSGVKALADAINRRGEPGKVVRHSRISGAYTIRYDIQDYKRVSIIIPTRNLGDILDRCLQSIFEKSTYPNYEVILVDNGTDEAESLAIFDAWKQREPQRFQCHRFDIPFNYSRLNNYGVSKASGDYLLFLNNDTEVITADWIEGMVEQAQRPSTGAVGALLLYPDDTVQHAGVVLGIGGVAGHSHKNFGKDDEGYVRQLICTSNYSAVTAACLMCRREVYEKVAGFNETLKVAFNDIDFCLKIKKIGYNNVYLPHVSLYHYESKSRGAEDTPEKQERFCQERDDMLSRWGEIILNDPCYSSNLSLETEDYNLKIQTRPEVLEVTLIPQEDEMLWGYNIDMPKLGQLDAGPMVIAGWVVGRKSPVKAIEVLCEGQVVHETEINVERFDVAQVFPDVAGAEKSGFVTMMNIIGLPQEAEFILQAVLEESQYIKLAKVKICY
jgi:glycosyltransferase involved in cell wall biosynthesis